MKFEVGTAQERWAKAIHPMYEFIFNTVHPDIDLRMNDSPAGRAYPSSQANNVAVPCVPRRFAHA